MTDPAFTPAENPAADPAAAPGIAVLLAHRSARIRALEAENATLRAALVASECRQVAHNRTLAPAEPEPPF